MDLPDMNHLDRRMEELRAAGRTGRTEGQGIGPVALAKAAEAPDRLVVIDRDREVTRGEMVDLACRLGGALMARGIEPGAAIAFQLPNWWEACVINLAAALFGFRLVPLLTIYRAAELGVILPACGVEALFVPETFREQNFPELVASLPHPPRHVFVVRGTSARAASFESLLSQSAAAPLLPSGDDAKLVLFTSGSTGRPKGVIHSHASVDAIIQMAGAFWSIGGADRLYVPSPVGHIGGSIYAFEFPWITDCAAVLADRWEPAQAVADIERLDCTFMAGATPFLEKLIEAADRAGTRLAGLRRFICGGASVPPELVRRGLDRFENAVVSRAYGSSEVPLVCPGIRDREEAALRADTDGACAAELSLLDTDGQPVAEGEPGEIAVRAPWMFLGYLDPNDEAGCFLDDGFFLMGDLGQRVDGTYLRITGRTKDIIIRKGENISPLEIENALMRHASVRQASVIGVPDVERGEMVVAFVIPRENDSFDFFDMVRHLEELGLARQKFPERLETVEALPLNAVGKVQKRELRNEMAKKLRSISETSVNSPL
jgi:acyl-CoA synthetase (AMP-forming)/AMP-acid ligase II